MFRDPYSDDNYDCCPRCSIGYQCDKCAKRFERVDDGNYDPRYNSINSIANSIDNDREDYYNDTHGLDDEYGYRDRYRVRYKTAYKTAPTCKCGQVLVKKTNKNTENIFWGCPDYKTCRFRTTYNFSEFGIKAPLPPLPPKTKHLYVVIDKEITSTRECHYYEYDDRNDGFFFTHECNHPNKVRGLLCDESVFPSKCPLKNFK